MSPSLIRVKGDYYGPFMKYIYTGSEPANDIAVKKATLYNIYSMSESLFTVCQFVIDKPYSIVPIGNPRFNLPIKLLNERGVEVKEGKIGEFCFYNPYCRGYVHNDKENKIHFIDGYFHTGDLAIYENGQYTLKGRSDDMIKIAGNRIEPSEIEAACNQIMHIKQSVAKGFEKEGIVVLYYIGDVDFDEEAVKSELRKKLPYYMIPSYFVKVSKIPLSKSGKIDKKALLLPNIVVQEEYVAPRNEFEKYLANKFSDVLKITDIGIDDDFFKMGGESLKVMKVLSLIDDEIITPTMIYTGKTIRKISELYDKEKAKYLSVEEKEKIGREANYPISKYQKWFWDNVNNGSLDFYSCFRLSPLIPAKTIVKRLNKYIEYNSTFDMVFLKGKDGWPIQACVPKHYVVLEHMSKKELDQLMDDFVSPFGYGEPLIRIRLVKSGLHTYLFFQASHVVTDGAGVHFILDDMKSVLSGKEIDPVYYFAYTYDEHMRDQSENFHENLKHFNHKYFEKNYMACLKTDEDTGKEGQEVIGPATINLKLVQDYCEYRGISVNTFLIAAGLLAQSAYNKTSENMIRWNFNNRGPKETRAGLMMRTTYCSLNLKHVHNVKELYKSINEQNQQNLPRLYDCGFNQYYKQSGIVPTFTITYLEDWFTNQPIPKRVGTEVELKNNSVSRKNEGRVFLLTCTHENGNLNAMLQYGTKFLKKENAERYIKLLQHTMWELINDSFPF